MTRDDALELVKTVWDRYWSYHNWKETSAWGAVGLYLVFVGLFVELAPEATDELVRAIVLTTGGVLVGRLVLKYVDKQHDLTAEAAQVNSACARLWAQLLSMSAGSALPGWNVAVVPRGDFAPSAHLPGFIVDEALRVGVLPRRRDLASLGRAVLVTAIVFSIVMVWLPWIHALAVCAVRVICGHGCADFA